MKIDHVLSIIFMLSEFGIVPELGTSFFVPENLPNSNKGMHTLYPIPFGRIHSVCIQYDFVFRLYQNHNIVLCSKQSLATPKPERKQPSPPISLTPNIPSPNRTTTFRQLALNISLYLLIYPNMFDATSIPNQIIDARLVDPSLLVQLCRNVYGRDANNHNNFRIEVSILIATKNKTKNKNLHSNVIDVCMS